MKKFIQFICITLALSLLLVVPAYAQSTVEPRGSIFFSSYGTALDKRTSTSFEIWFDVDSNACMLDILGVSDSAVANMLNKFNVSARNVHAFAMDEWADEDGNVAPLTYGAGLGYSFMNHFYGRIREDLRPPVDHWHTHNNDNKGTDVYSNMIDEITGGGVDVVYTATGWPGHTAFIDPRTEEFKADSLEEFCKLGSRIVTETPLTICENSLFGPMGASGDVWAVPYKAATIGPRDICNAKERVELHNFVNADGSSWQRMVSRLELYGPITQDFPASILRLGKGTCYVSEAIAMPFSSWPCGLEDRYL